MGHSDKLTGIEEEAEGLSVQPTDVGADAAAASTAAAAAAVSAASSCSEFSQMKRFYAGEM